MTASDSRDYQREEGTVTNTPKHINCCLVTKHETPYAYVDILLLCFKIHMDVYIYYLCHSACQNTHLKTVVLGQIIIVMFVKCIIEPYEHHSSLFDIIKT